MADPPAWDFGPVAATTRWIAGYGLATTNVPPADALDHATWMTFRAECERHRLGGLLVAAATNGDLPVTDRQRAEMATLEIELTRHRTAYDARCRAPLAALADHGIEVLLLKGAALPWSDYPDPQWRPTGDLDVLVRTEDLYRSVQVLEGLGGRLLNPEPAPGYATHVFKGLTIVLEGGFEVDLHRILSWGSFGVRVPAADLWTSPRTFDRFGTPAQTLDRARTLLHLSAHMLLLGAVRLSEARDVAQLLADPLLDVDEVLRVARAWRQEAVLATAIRLSVRELGLAAEGSPLIGWSADVPVSRGDRARLRIEQPTSPIKGVEQLAVFASLPRGPGRRIQLRALLRPTTGTDPNLGMRLRSFARRSRRREIPTPAAPTPQEYRERADVQ